MNHSSFANASAGLSLSRPAACCSFLGEAPRARMALWGRGVWVGLSGLLISLLAACTIQAEEITLFDGSSLAAWRGYNESEPPAGWVIQDGLLYRKSGGGDLMTRDKFADFELEFEWKISPGGNSGVMYRVREGDPAAYYSGPEYQILDSSKLHDESSRLTAAGSLYAMYPSPATAEQPSGQWNAARIIVRGNRIEHWLNGTKVVDCEIGSDDWNQRLAASKFADWDMFASQSTGHIVLQDHGDEVWYRNLRVTRLDAN